MSEEGKDRFRRPEKFRAVKQLKITEMSRKHDIFLSSEEFFLATVVFHELWSSFNHNISQIFVTNSLFGICFLGLTWDWAP